MNPNYEMILKSFVERCTLNGTFVMSLPLNSVRRLHLHPWKPPKGYPSLEVFLGEIEKEIFAIPDSRLGYSNLSLEE